MTTPSLTRKVLKIDAVRLSIQELHRSNVHEQFLAYLFARKWAIEQGTLTRIKPNMNEIKAILEVPGGPPNKPYFMPISSRTRKHISGHWLNPNPAGSYAPSSLREASSFMRGAAPRSYDLPDNHAQQSLDNHLNGVRQEVWQLAAYLLRNYSFAPTMSTASDLVDSFREVFLFESAAPGSDFDTLFTTGNEPDIKWFEPIIPAVGGRSPATDPNIVADDYEEDDDD